MAIQWRWATNFFSDEKQAYDKMISDGVSDSLARQFITK